MRKGYAATCRTRRISGSRASRQTYSTHQVATKQFRKNVIHAALLRHGCQFLFYATSLNQRCSVE